MLRLLALVLALLVVPKTAVGQVFVSAGAASPLTPEAVTDIYRSGYSVAVGFVLESAAFPFARLRPFGSYHKFRTEPGPFEAQFVNIDEIDGGEMPVIFAGADVQFRRPFAAFTPFVAPAVGIAVFTIDDITADGITFNLRDEVSGFALGVSGGLAYSFNRTYQLFVEGQYVRAFVDGEDRSFVPVRLGLELNFDY